jgi:hypothetical protein
VLLCHHGRVCRWSRDLQHLAWQEVLVVVSLEPWDLARVEDISGHNHVKHLLELQCVPGVVFMAGWTNRSLAFCKGLQSERGLDLQTSGKKRLGPHWNAGKWGRKCFAGKWDTFLQTGLVDERVFIKKLHRHQGHHC